jgi:antitoxin-like ribbon-helix-helix protein
MSKPKPNFLAAALNKSARGVETTAPAPKASAARRERPTPHKQAPTREGRVMVSGWLPLAARGSFRLIQAKHPDKKMQDLVTEAMNDLFAKYNVPQTAHAPTNVPEE